MEQPLLGRDAAERAPRSGLSHFFYAACFIFSPVPLHGMLIMLEMTTLSRRGVFRLPSYLTVPSRVVIRLIALTTFLSLVVFVGLVIVYLLTFHISAPIKITSEAKIPGEATVCWCRLSLQLVLARGAVRYGSHQRTSTLAHLHSASSKAGVEHLFDLIGWTWLKLLCSVRLFNAVRAGGPEHLEKFGLDPFERQAIFGISSACIATTSADLVLSIAWLLVTNQVHTALEANNAIDTIDNLPAVDASEDCPICLTAEEDGGGSCRIACGHVFHRGCLVSWVSSQDFDATRGLSCPICRRDFTQAAGTSVE